MKNEKVKMEAVHFVHFLKNAGGVKNPVRRTQLPFLILRFAFLIFNLNRGAACRLYIETEE